MYTSEIRETDHEGNPVAVSPELLRQVRAADDDLREWLSDETRLEYSGLWRFPGADRAALALTLAVPNVPDPFTVTLPFDPRRAERFPYHAIQSVLRLAGDVVQARLDRRISDLVTSAVEGE